MATKPPLRPATPIDSELAKPAPEEVTEIEKRKQEAEKEKKTADRADV